MISLDSAIRRHAISDPERVAIVFDEIAISYSQLIERVDRLAEYLSGADVKRGDIIALLMRNSPAFVELALAASMIGAILLPLNYRLTVPEVSYILDHSGAGHLFVDH